MRQSSSAISMDELDALLDDQLAGSAKQSRRELVSQQMSMDDIDALLGAAGGGAPTVASPKAAPAKPKPAGIKPGVRPSQQMDMAEIADLLDKQKNSELNRTYAPPAPQDGSSLSNTSCTAPSWRRSARVPRSQGLPHRTSTNCSIAAPTEPAVPCLTCARPPALASLRLYVMPCVPCASDTSAGD